MSVVDQKEYLKKYLGIGKGSGDKKKKKKSKKTSNGLKIVDDNVDISLSREIQEDLEADNEDTPQIVSVIDDRPPSLRVDEVTQNHLWKPIGAPEIPSDSAKSLKFEGNIKLSKKLDKIGIISSKHSRIDSYKQPRNKIQAGSPEDPDFSPRRRSKNSDSDSSPPRYKKKVDNPPVRRKNTSENGSPRQNKTSKSRNRDDDDKSPPRKSRRRNSEDYSPPRRDRKNINSSLSNRTDHQRNEDSSPPRRARKNDNDNSPPRKSRRKYSEDHSPPRIKQEKSEDGSPPRRAKKDGSEKNEDSSPPRRARKIDDDNSPPRKSRSNIDSSPPRRIKREKSLEGRGSKQDDDYSPPRRIRTERNEGISPRGKIKDSSSHSRKKSRWGDEEEHDKLKKTLDGKKAGLQRASDLVDETIQLKKREDELFKNMSAEVSGANAATVVRHKKKEIDWEEEERKRKREEENKEKYDKWGKGLKQVEDRSERIKNELYEMSKPLARYADDKDLEKYLKDQEREGDPMLAYIRQKKKKTSVDDSKPVTQQYQGNAPPNRFGIRPGYRWDGVDRSNGYERQWFQIQNSRKASLEESYKWSTEDM